jgi:ERCC4-related helicase
VILTTDRTADEGYLHAGIRREKQMKRMVKRLAEDGIRGGATPAAQESSVESRVGPQTKVESVQRTIEDYGGGAG